MKTATFAPHLTGRVLPALFSAAPEFKTPRFPGDPWATQPHWAAWFWMHTTECGSPNYVGSCKAWTIPRALRCDETHATASPDVGPMGAGQPADADPAAGQFELFAEVEA